LITSMKVYNLHYIILNIRDKIKEINYVAKLPTSNDDLMIKQM
jgi:hypothetical protein